MPPESTYSVAADFVLKATDGEPVTMRLEATTLTALHAFSDLLIGVSALRKYALYFDPEREVRLIERSTS